MALAVESIGLLILNIGLFTGGMAFAILGIVLAISRSMTKNQDHYAIIFASFSWLIALIVPNLWYSSIIFGFGAFALILSFMPIIERTGDKNIFVLAIIAGLLNLLLLIGTDAYTISLSWQTDLNDSVQDITNIMGLHEIGFQEGTPEYKLCTPNEMETNSSICESDAIGGDFVADLFVPFASILTIGTYIGKAIAFMGMATLAPIVISTHLASQGYFQNTIILFLMGILVTLWQMAIFYKLVAFILNKRGMK